MYGGHGQQMIEELTEEELEGLDGILAVSSFSCTQRIAECVGSSSGLPTQYSCGLPVPAPRSIDQSFLSALSFLEHVGAWVILGPTFV